MGDIDTYGARSGMYLCASTFFSYFLAVFPCVLHVAEVFTTTVAVVITKHAQMSVHQRYPDDEMERLVRYSRERGIDHCSEPVQDAYLVLSEQAPADRKRFVQQSRPVVCDTSSSEPEVRTSKKSKKPKDPNAPKKPLTGYNKYVMDQTPFVKKVMGLCFPYYYLPSRIVFVPSHV